MIICLNDTKVMLDSHPKEVGKYPLITNKDATDCWYWMYTLVIQILIPKNKTIVSSERFWMLL